MPPTKVYYQDKTLTVGEDTLDGRGVQAIVQDHPTVGAEIVTGSDYYILEKDRWRGVDIFGLFDFLLDSGVVLFGRTVRGEEYNALMKQALQDKSAWLPGERRT